MAAPTGAPSLMSGIGDFNPKNIMSQAAMDLGMGDALRQQLEDDVQRRKQAGANIGQMDTNAMSPAALALFGKLNGFGA